MRFSKILHPHAKHLNLCCNAWSLPHGCHLLASFLHALISDKGSRGQSVAQALYASFHSTKFFWYFLPFCIHLLLLPSPPLTHFHCRLPFIPFRSAYIFLLLYNRHIPFATNLISVSSIIPFFPCRLTESFSLPCPPICLHLSTMLTRFNLAAVGSIIYLHLVAKTAL